MSEFLNLFQDEHEMKENETTFEISISWSDVQVFDYRDC